MPQILRPALLAIVACTAVAGSALVGAPKAHAIGACPTLVQGTDFTTFSDLQTLFTAQRFCDEGSMTVDFTSDFTWPDDASLTWDGQDHQPLLLRGTGPNTPTVTGYKAAVIVNNSDGGLTVSNLTTGGLSGRATATCRSPTARSRTTTQARVRESPWTEHTP